jgi:hypothetical protein
MAPARLCAAWQKRYFRPIESDMAQLFSGFVNWFTHGRKITRHPVVHRMA